MENRIYSDKFLHIGKILMCEKDEDFGILVGFYDDYRSIKGPILLSFSKQVGKVFPKKCFVYYIVESEAPEGYQINNEKMYFEILEDGEIVKCTMTDEKIIIEVPIYSSIYFFIITCIFKCTWFTWL